MPRPAAVRREVSPGQDRASRAAGGTGEGAQRLGWDTQPGGGVRPGVRPLVAEKNWQWGAPAPPGLRGWRQDSQAPSVKGGVFLGRPAA